MRKCYACVRELDVTDDVWTTSKSLTQKNDY